MHIFLKKQIAVPIIIFCEWMPLKKTTRWVKVALDGGTRPGDTLQILPLALAQPPNPRSITSHSVLRGHPSLTNRVGFFRGIHWGIHSQKIIIRTAICFFKKMCISDEKYWTHTLYIILYVCVCVYIIYCIHYV